MSGPVAITAMVGSPFSIAALWAQMSVPSARPLTIRGRSFVDASPSTVFEHHSFPYGEMSLVPTMASEFSVVHSSVAGVRLLI